MSKLHYLPHKEDSMKKKLSDEINHQGAQLNAVILINWLH